MIACSYYLVSVQSTIYSQYYVAIYSQLYYSVAIYSQLYTVNNYVAIYSQLYIVNYIVIYSQEFTGWLTQTCLIWNQN